MGKWIATSNGSFFAPTNVTVAGFVVGVCAVSFFRSKKELYYIKAEYIIKLHKALSKYSRTKLFQKSIPNLCKKLNRRLHRQTLSKQAENTRPKNGDQHPCRLERAQSSSSFLRLFSSSFCHRWRRETDPNLSDPRLIDISSEDRFSQALHRGWI